MTDSTKPQEVGKWEYAPNDFKHLAVHTALLHTGKILGFGGSGNDKCYESDTLDAEIWDPQSGNVHIVQNNVSSDLFCAGHSQLADGRLLVAGGTHLYEDITAFRTFTGLDESYVFNPLSETWEEPAKMKHGRWYPTLVTLGDGRVLNAAGLTKEFPYLDLKEIEIYTPGEGWRVLDGADKHLPLYPRLILLPNGEIMYANAYNVHYLSKVFPWKIPPTMLLNLEENSDSKWRVIDRPEREKREEAASVLLPLEPPDYEAKVMLIGGGTPTGGHATNRVEVIEPLKPNAEWKEVASMKNERYYNYVVILPNKKILVLGGRRGNKGHHGIKNVPCDQPIQEPTPNDLAVREAEMYDPVTDEWTTLASMKKDRLYHSSAHLLMDGRIAMFGSNPARRVNELKIEIFSPPYLFAENRPEILNSPDSVGYGESFTIEVDDAESVSEVLLIRFGASTHCLNTDQRLVVLPSEREQLLSNQMRCEVPANPNLLPPGYYMLHVLVGDVPSESQLIRIS